MTNNELLKIIDESIEQRDAQLALIEHAEMRAVSLTSSLDRLVTIVTSLTAISTILAVALAIGGKL